MLEESEACSGDSDPKKDLARPLRLGCHDQYVSIEYQLPTKAVQIHKDSEEVDLHLLCSH